MKLLWGMLAARVNWSRLLVSMPRPSRAVLPGLSPSTQALVARLTSWRTLNQRWSGDGDTIAILEQIGEASEPLAIPQLDGRTIIRAIELDPGGGYPAAPSPAGQLDKWMTIPPDQSAVAGKRRRLCHRTTASLLVLQLRQTPPGSAAGIRGWAPAGDMNVA
jgi:hypothetical protein